LAPNTITPVRLALPASCAGVSAVLLRSSMAAGGLRFTHYLGKVGVTAPLSTPALAGWFTLLVFKAPGLVAQPRGSRRCKVDELFSFVDPRTMPGFGATRIPGSILCRRSTGLSPLPDGAWGFKAVFPQPGTWFCQPAPSTPAFRLVYSNSSAGTSAGTLMVLLLAVAMALRREAAY